MLLDTTLRDGSYVIDFNFSTSQTSKISKGLEDANIPYIEIGHGIGINASEKGLGQALQTDEEYMVATKEVLTRSKWGMFAIPGICELPNLDVCIDHQMDFIRIGVSIDDYKRTKEFIEKAKNAGIMTCVNFMKSYARSPVVFEMAAREVINYGADFVYLVDSAGNLTPNMIQKYCERISDIPFGFHGHDNLGLGNANALVAHQLGASIIDCSLQGLGRSAGNTQLEQFVAILQRENHELDIDLLRLIDLSEQYIRPLLSSVGSDGLDLICGYSGFHSSYMGMVREVALKYNVDPRVLIIELCKLTLDDAPLDTLKEIAIDLNAKGIYINEQSKSSLARYFGSEQSSL